MVNIKKKEAAAKKEAGGDEKHLIFFTWPYQLFDIVQREGNDSWKVNTARHMIRLFYLPGGKTSLIRY